MSGWFTFQIAAFFIESMYLVYSCIGVEIERVEVYIYIIHSHDGFCRNHRTMVKSVKIEKSLKNKAFSRILHLAELTVEMAENIENKGFYRT